MQNDVDYTNWLNVSRIFNHFNKFCGKPHTGEGRAVAIAADLSAFAVISSGFNVGWASPYLPVLLDQNNTHIKTTSDEAYWCAVISLVGAFPGAILSTLLVDRMGRKTFILSAAPIITAALISMAFAETILNLIISRFVIGICDIALYTALPIYFGEIADPEIRGLMGSSVPIAAIIGQIFINAIGPFLSIKESSLVCTAVPIIHFFTFLWMPESPYYLLKIGDEELAKRSLIRLRGKEDVGDELKEIASAVKRQESVKKLSVLDIAKVASFRKGAIIYLALSFTNKFSGKTPFMLYSTIIFTEAGDAVNPVIPVILFSVVSLIATISAMFIVDRFGRRPLMISSGFGCAISLIICATYFTLQFYIPQSIEHLYWMPILSLITYNIIFSFGLSFGPVLFLSEIFPTTIKVKALVIANATNALMGTVTSKFFQLTSDASGMFVPFWCFAVFTIVGSTVIYYKVPETKGKTLEEIQLDLIGRPKENQKDKA